MEIIPVKTGKIQPHDNLVEIILKSVKIPGKIRNGDIVCIVSKVVSLTEGRIISLESARAECAPARENFPQKSARADQFQLQMGSRERISASTPGRYGKYNPDPALDALIRKEADKLYSNEMYLTIKNGIFTPAAGIDTSNVPEGTAILWPRDAYKSAEKIRTQLLQTLNIKHLGIVIFDSFILPLRRGVSGIALGYAGFEGTQTYKNKKDLYGKRLRVTSRNIADNLAATSTLVCGEGNESTPFVIIRNAIGNASVKSIKFTNQKIRRSEIQVPPDQCLYKSLYSYIPTTNVGL